MPKETLTKPEDFGELPTGFTVDKGILRNPDGTPRMTLDMTDTPAEDWICITGPIGGLVQTEDGTVYDVTPHAIVVPDRHKDELHALIGRERRARGLDPAD